MWSVRAWLVVLAAWSARAGPGPPPQLTFPHALYNVSIAENSAPKTYAIQPPAEEPLGLLLPAADARVRFRIRHGDKDKFFKAEEKTVGDFCFLYIRTRTGNSDVLNRERKDFYQLEIRATAQMPNGRQLEADTLVHVTVTDENDLSPLFYPTEYDVLVPEDTSVHSSIARVTAEDADLGINGEIYYSIEKSSDQFAIHPTSGIVTITRPLAIAEKSHHDITVLARDRASLLAKGINAPAAKASLSVHVSQVNLHAPELKVRRLPELVENSTAEIYAIIEVHDRDPGEHGRIASLDIVDGDPDGHFRVRPSRQTGEYDVVVHALLDRESTPRGYNLTLRASDAGRPPRASYITLPVTLVDINDNAPVFSREVYEANVPETAPPNTPVIRLKVTDRDEGRNGRVYIEIVGGNEGNEFFVNPDTGVLYTTVALDAEEKSLYILTVSAIDQGNVGTRKQSSAKVKISILDSNDNDPVFEKDDIEVVLAENGPTGTVVARVLARDADSGENAYISYSIANLQPVPFDVDHFSGSIRTSRILDYESMRREYVLRIRASDWGLPYRRQAEMKLTIRLQDVNDNRPQFERVDCVGYLPKRLSIGSEIVTLSAIDFDAGDVVSYRLIGGNEDNCFVLDTGSGVISLACDLSDLRLDTRVLNVTATDGTHFADPTSLVLHLVSGAGSVSGLECRDTGIARRLTELFAAAERSNAPIDMADEFPLAPSRYGENLHSPEFVDFPVEVKVNESVALGTSLVKLKARDRDLGYNGLLTYGISGGDTDSAFRIDPDTGELKVIGYLDRERESEYYLNVTVYDLGEPQRSASRLLPVTVLDVNDNAPKFEKTLASFRVTENALNGTSIFRANATDKDSGYFAKVRYSVSGAGEGEFCVDSETGVLYVCAQLDRERRAIYELTIRATDGGGLYADALVRVAVDDVNDNSPRFSLNTYSARVREDVPSGTLVAVLDAFDPDLGSGGVVTYSLPDQAPDDVIFTVDSTSGVLRTAKWLDFEERQVYGVTVRATDGGQPSLWSEATVIVEVVDVDENAHSPTFADRVLIASVKEDASPGTSVLTATAKDADPPGRDSRLAYYIVAGSGLAHFSVDDAGILRTLTPLDRETTPHYWLTLCAQDHGLVPRHSCVQVYIEVEDVNDMAPWPEQASYHAHIPEHSPAGKRIVRVQAYDGDASPYPINITYSIVAGNPEGLFSIDEKTGEIVTTGRILDREAVPTHALEVQCSDGELSTTTRVHVTLDDLNDHSPVFTQRFYEINVPLPVTLDGDTDSLPQGDGADLNNDEVSVEWEDDDEGSGAKTVWDNLEEQPNGVYLMTVLALDSDSGENGTVRYSARGRGGTRALRVHARSGRLYAVQPLSTLHAYDLTVRACDGGNPAKCSSARAAVRGKQRGGGRPPTIPSVPGLQAAELDAPGFLLTLLQANDPDGDSLYYDIVEGDPNQDFYIGREDGSLVLAKKLVWERQGNYSLNISVTDGANFVYTTVNITVINDANEGGVAFSRSEYVVETSEATRVGEALVALKATTGMQHHKNKETTPSARILYGIHATRSPASAKLFRLNEITGVLELAQSLDSESASIHELTIWARDQAPRSSRAYCRVIVKVHDFDEHAPEWGLRLAQALIPKSAPINSLVAALRAADKDVGDAARIIYSLSGGSGIFTIDPTLGDVRLVHNLPQNGPKEYTLHVKASNPPPVAKSSTLPLHIVIVEPDNAPPVFTKSDLVCEVYENSPSGTSVATLEARSSSAVWYSLEGGEGMFRANPAAASILTASSLDYETKDFYNLTLVGVNMGGGESRAHVSVHVLDRNEYAPTLTKRLYHGKASESLSIGALVLDADISGEPLVLKAEDLDSPANRQRSYEILEPNEAKRFHIDPTTGALRLARQLDYEQSKRHEFTVKVLDMGTPRLPSDSKAKVIIDVIDVNDCAPIFEKTNYETNILLPTWKDVAVLNLNATDSDLPPNGSVKYDIIEGDDNNVFSLSNKGVLTIDKPDELSESYKLRVRASDGLYSSTARVKIRVKESDNSGLAFQKSDYYGSILENSTKPVTITVLNVLGAALNEHIEFKILNPVDGFEVGKTSGAVRSTGLPLDRESREAYTLVVQAMSEAPLDSEFESRVAHTRVHITLTDVNDNCPVFVERPYVGAVSAGSSPGTDVITVKALDKDAGDNSEVRYEMKRGHGELFRVDRKTGQIVLKQTMDMHNQLYTLVIAAFDGGVPACGSEAEVSVRVWGGGAAPTWQRAHYWLSVKEDAEPGTAISATPTLRARSPLRRTLIYTLLDPHKHPAFQLHFDTAPDRGNNPCTLVISSSLDYEKEQSHDLVIRATDGVTGAFADAAVTVKVQDVNDCAPNFDRDVYTASVSEAAEIDDVVIVMKAKDNDTGVNGEISYSISGENNDSLSFFTIDSETGIIRIKSQLDAETSASHHLLIRATDKGRPPLDTTAHLFITVDDVNDSPPQMERSVVTALVSEEAARGTPLARVAAWDPDIKDAVKLRYAPAPHEPPTALSALSVNPISGLITLSAPARLAVKSLNVSVSDGAHASFARVKFIMAPANRAAPHFPHLVYEARAAENRQPPLLLTTIKAYDDDAGEYGSITYSIPSAKLRETFSIDSTTGALTTRVPLDREKRSEWEIPVMASDGGGLLKHTMVRVKVSDENDNAPVFPLREYCATVRYDMNLHVPFLTLQAKDADVGDNSKIKYSVYEGDLKTEIAGLFEIDALTGALAFAKNISAFASRSLQVWVRATDSGGKASEAPARISILSPGDTSIPNARSPPQALFLREDAVANTLVADVKGTADSYRLAPGLYPRDLFSVDSDGKLTLTGTLDRETAAEHFVGIIAEGTGSPAPATLVTTTIHVLDVNEHAPSFHSQPYVVHLAENTPPHSSIVQIMADDPDSGSNGEVRYTLAEESDSTLFAIDPHTGWVTTISSLDRELKAEHRIAILASDGGQMKRVSRGMLVIKLVDYNDCPHRFEKDEYVAQISEDAAPGSTVTNLLVIDDDSLPISYSYTIASGDPRALFGIRHTGELYVARQLDRETEPSYKLQVIATDGKFAAQTTVLITVLDVNDNPPYCLRHRYTIRLPEDAKLGTPLVTILTTDADEPQNARLRYYLTSDTNKHPFTANKDTGSITVSGALNRERDNMYTLTAHAQDKDKKEWECSSQVIVHVDDVNDNAPSFTAETYSVTLPEDAEIGTLVAKVHATDPDLGENRFIRYSFVDEQTGVFDLATDSGIVTLRAPLDRETQAEHKLIIRAMDGGRPVLSSTATLRLTVSDVNDNPPEFEFEQYKAVVPELDVIGTEVARVRATSRDTGVNADVHYSLIGGDDRDDFSMDSESGAIIIARQLDYELRKEYLLTIQAIDGGSPPLSDLASVNVTVTDCNDNAPVFSQVSYGARIKEDAVLGTNVLQVIADDADSGLNGRVTYSLGRGSDSGRFRVDPDSGHVSVAASLDRETAPAHVLEIRARDKGVPSLEASTLVNIEIVDANDNPPLFALSNYSAFVQEDKPLGHTILKLEVTDADAPPNASPYTFDFQSGNEAGAFRIEQDGSLRSATKFNHRIKDKYILQVRVFDNGTPPLFSDAWIYISVIEESQYPPIITPLEVVINSYLDEFPGGVVARVIASDRDTYDTLTYSLGPVDGSKYPPTDLFEINSNDGSLSASPRLDVGDYKLNVTATDGKFTSFALIRVSVLLITDEMLSQAVVVRFRAVSDRDFVLGHRKGFIRAIREATDCEANDVIIVGVQASGDDTLRQKRQVARDLDVAFTVRFAGSYLPAETLRRRLHEHLERLEERTRLVVEELVRVACGGCVHGACSEKVELRMSDVRTIATDVFSLVTPPHKLKAHCVCTPGYTGDRCELVACTEPECGTPTETIAHLTGDGYLSYRIEKGHISGARLIEDELTFSIRFRTLSPRGVLFSAFGRIDYLIIEIAEGFVQARMELGSGPVGVRAANVVSDGAWHSLSLERSGAELRLTVDRRSTRAHGPPPSAILDARTDRVLVGATLVKHAHANAPEQVTYGFRGCIADLKLNSSPLPLEEGSITDSLGTLVRRLRVHTGVTCPALQIPGPCANYPCLNGGTCHEVTPLLEDDSTSASYTCSCHARYLGAHCERDADPCASSPCLHAGVCSIHPGPLGYSCECSEGLSGDRCEKGKYCSPSVCEHGGTCEEGERGPSCRCRGYFGPRCRLDVDECAGEPCLNGATCVNEPGSFRCLCPPDKTGMNCGNPLYSDAVMSGGAESQTRWLRELWAWANDARWPLFAGLTIIVVLILTIIIVPFVVRKKRRPVTPPPAKIPPRASKLSNLEAQRSRPLSTIPPEPPQPLNNVDTLRSYGSAGDELEGLPPHYIRNLNINQDQLDRKPWSEQMHLRTFVDNKIYNDLKPASPVNDCAGGAGTLGVYHWDLSDWCPPAARPALAELAQDIHPDTDTTDPALESLLLPPPHPDEYMPREYSSTEENTRMRKREHDAHSLITMLEERNSLLGNDGGGSCSDLSVNLCEIEESDSEDTITQIPNTGARHTAV